MVAPLRTTSISIPGFYGMNTTDSGVTLDSGFARIAENCVIEEGGRLGARLGWDYVSQTDDVTPTQVDLKGLHRFIDVTGAEYFGAWSTTNFYVDNSGTLTEVPVSQHTLTTGSLTSSGTTATVTHINHGYSSGDSITIAGATPIDYNGTYTIIVVDQDTFTYTFAGSVTTPATGTITTELNLTTAGNWQAATLNDAAYLFQRGEDPLYFNPATGILDRVRNATNIAEVDLSNAYDVTITNGNIVTATHSGTTATIVQTGHKLTTGDTVVISGANESEYNGTFTVTVVNVNVYTYTMASSPGTDATGTVVARSNVATVSHTDHNRVTGDSVTISGANETDYNGTFTITVIDDNTYYYNTATIATSDATGDTIARTETVTVTHVGYDFVQGDTITISLATITAYNIANTPVTPKTTDTYTYEINSIPTADETDVEVYWSKGTPPNGNTVLSAYGRLWVADTSSNKTTVYWSNLLDGAEWRSDIGTVGSLDISGILINGNDEIVALGAHNGRLIIFCKHNIIIMDDQSAGKRYLDPADLNLVEVIEGIGCVARDSIENTGADILFLSESGVLSLGRTIQEKSQPIRDISRNIRDPLLTQVLRTNKDKIKATYSESFAFYLLAVPDDGIVWCFDTRQEMPDGSSKVTRWNSLTHTDWLAFDGKIYMSSPYGISEYKNRKDNGDSYDLQYFTPYFNFGMQNIVKVAKQVAITAYSSFKQQVRIKLNTDYELNSRRPIVVELNDSLVYQYNFDQYGITTTTIAAAQAANTITDQNGIHYAANFSTTQTTTYDTELKVWLDADTFYYTTDNGTRTRVSLYFPHGDFAAEYGGNDAVDNVKVSVGGAGFVIQLGFESTIDGGFVSIQQVDLFVKQGRLR